MMTAVNKVGRALTEDFTPHRPCAESHSFAPFEKAALTSQSLTGEGAEAVPTQVDAELQSKHFTPVVLQAQAPQHPLIRPPSAKPSEPTSHRVMLTHV